jgi:hypothetical protein
MQMAPTAKKVKAPQPEKASAMPYNVVRIEEKDQPDEEYGTGEMLRGFGVKFLKLPLNFDLATIHSTEVNKYGNVTLTLKDSKHLSLGAHSCYKWSRISVEWGPAEKYGVNWKTLDGEEEEDDD